MSDKQPAWYFGNTTVRNPLRIRSGLIALENSTLNGYLIGKESERRFADVLSEAGVVDITKSEREYSDMGRKWRACFSQLGFITHRFESKDLGEKEDIIKRVGSLMEGDCISGLSFEITPNGRRMILAETFPEQQECMLRALLAYELPSPIQQKDGKNEFNPLYFMLQVLKQLSYRSDIGLSNIEMGILMAIRTHEDSAIDSIVEKFINYREALEIIEGKVARKKFSFETVLPYSEIVGIKADSLSKDYPDLVYRYLRYTGLFSFQGRRLVLNYDKQPVIDAILGKGIQLFGKSDPDKYLARLWNGAGLPTDDKENAIAEISRLKQLIIQHGAAETSLPEADISKPVSDVNQIRLRLEELHKEQMEQDYANSQAEEENVFEIISFLRKLDNKRDEFTDDIQIYDKPAYLEWAVWRAFLAIDSLVKPSYEARRFKVDQDFLPVGTAPGRGPDMVFEFEDYALVVEVTLTTSSRQEAAEGEPVRRHVAVEKARVLAESGKPVYGLFIAGVVDNNTAETFRIGVWYSGDDPEFINIVPITLEQFTRIMVYFQRKNFSVKQLRSFFDECLITRNAHAPAWKEAIEISVSSFTE